MTDVINFIDQNQETVIILTGVILLVFFIWNIYLSYNLSRVKKRTRSFFASSEAKDLEEIIYKQIKKTNEVDVEIKKLIEDNGKIRGNMAKCVQKVGVVRFNPFGDVGGNQSFAIALLDKYLSGVIILSLYSRDDVKVYSKQIIEGKSEYTLSKEEEEAIRIADEKL
jgi:transcription antitermination factor NusA-like protein